MLRSYAVALLLLLSFPLIARSGDAPADALLNGTWLPAKAEFAGKPWPEEVRKITKLVIDGEKYVVTVGDAPDKGTLKIDSSFEPKAIDITGVEGPNKGKTYLAIYEQSDPDTLKICYDLSGNGRPTEFKSAAGTKLFLVTYTREKKN